ASADDGGSTVFVERTDSSASGLGEQNTPIRERNIPLPAASVPASSDSLHAETGEGETALVIEQPDIGGFPIQRVARDLAEDQILLGRQAAGHIEVQSRHRALPCVPCPSLAPRPAAFPTIVLARNAALAYRSGSERRCPKRSRY